MRAYVAPESTAAVFASPDSARLRVNNFRRREWDKAVRSAGLGRLRVHDMRHTAVALWISTGVPSLLVSQQAGHSSVAFTLDRYGHLYGNAGTELADRLDALAGADVVVGANVVPLRSSGGAA
jgi:integrase